MSFDLTEDQELIRDSARDFTEQYVQPGVMERDASKEFPHELVQQLGEMGLMGMVHPEEYDGAGADAVSFALVLEEIGRWDASLALTVASHTSLCSAHIALAGTHEQKNRYLRPLAQGEVLGGWGLTEPGSGSDASGMKTTAVRDGDSWILNGAKIFITQGTVGRTFVILAVTDRAKGTKGISAFIVEKGTPGFSHGPKLHKLGMNSSDTSELYFEDCRIPAENLLGEEGHGFIDTMKILDAGRIGIGAIACGILRGSLEESIKYANERKQFGKPIGDFQAVRWKVVDMAVAYEAARNMVLKAAWLKDQGRPYTIEASMAKLFASEQATKATLEAIQIHGGYGYTKEYHVERFLRDAKLLEIGEGTSEIQRLVIGKHLFR
ncbi:MAG: acyl-CoA dehydrogenase family protein [Bacteroidetes bacterium]|nr:acyl-CoA dehydrogenase family protein [Bacteroidota bacterium]MCH8523358.1 acyl-CoA dehydrogenase family protein [Balneolales bacterium]